MNPLRGRQLHHGLIVTAATTFGWERYADRSIGVDRFGASAPGAEVLERYGITAAAAAEAVRELLAA